MPKTRSPIGAGRDVGADGLDHSRELHAGNVGGNAGRRGIATGALQQVGAVETGAVDPHDDAVGGRLREGSLGHLQPAVDDRDRTHEPGT